MCHAAPPLLSRTREHEFATRISLSHRDHFSTLDLERNDDIRKLLDAKLVWPPRLQLRTTTDRESLSRLKRQHGLSTTRRYVSSGICLQRSVGGQRSGHAAR